MQMFIWQEDLFSVAWYICACMNLHATWLKDWALLSQLGLDGCNFFFFFFFAYLSSDRQVVTYLKKGVINSITEEKPMFMLNRFCTASWSCGRPRLGYYCA